MGENEKFDSPNNAKHPPPIVVLQNVSTSLAAFALVIDVQGGSSGWNLIFHFESLKAFLKNASLKGLKSLLANPVRIPTNLWILHSHFRAMSTCIYRESFQMTRSLLKLLGNDFRQ